MAINYHYAFAEIDPDTNMCIGVFTTTNAAEGDIATHVAIPEYNEDYVFKYYNWDDGQFYYDAEYTQIFNPNA